jgi:uncharacterized membrane protein YcaP (DUF421 family)
MGPKQVGIVSAFNFIIHAGRAHVATSRMVNPESSLTAALFSRTSLGSYRRRREIFAPFITNCFFIDYIADQHGIRNVKDVHLATIDPHGEFYYSVKNQS